MALQHSGAWSGPDRMEVAGEEHKVIACVSDLQIREALGQLEGENRAGILLCNFDPAALGDDVLARLSKPHPYPQKPVLNKSSKPTIS